MTDEAATQNFGAGDCRVFRVGEIKPHPNADSLGIIDAAGYQMVVRLGEFNPGDWAVHVSPDTMLPDDEKYAFVKNHRTMDFGTGKKSGWVVKTIRLRGQVSEGLVIPVPDGIEPVENANIAEEMGAVHYQKPMQSWAKGNLPGKAPDPDGYFPSFIPKTDAVRMETLVRDGVFPDGGFCLVTEKIDGTSMTVYRDNEGVLHVCSRNLRLKEGDNLYWNTAKQYAVENIYPGVALQGEVAGPGIQGNPLGLGHVVWFLYDAYLIRERKYSGAMLKQAARGVGASMVPFVCVTRPAAAHAYKELALKTGMWSELAPKPSEGLVFTMLGHRHRLRFKVINPQYKDGA